MARPSRLLAALGIVGPVAFTAAWFRQTLVQDGYSVRNEHISGLAASDARDPGVMVGGFLTLGASTIGFASAVEESLGGPHESGAAPLLLRVAGVSALIAGVFRRDMMLLHPPGRDPDYHQSWRNDVHDIASGVAYVCGIAAPLAIAWRAHHDPELERLVVPAIGSSVATAGALAVLASEVLEPWSGIVQRAAVSVPFVGSIGLAVGLLRSGPRNPSSAVR
jgi:hypothetical protein